MVGNKFFGLVLFMILFIVGWAQFLHGQTYNHVQLAQLLTSMTKTHKSLVEFRATPGQTNLSLEEQFEYTNRLLAEYDYLWGKLQVILEATEKEEVVEKASRLQAREKKTKELLSGVAAFAHANANEGRKTT